MRWTWDPKKNEANLRNHRIEFETAVLVFSDPLALTLEDPYPHEQRWRTVGMVGTVVIVVVHTWPLADSETGEQVGRIISARKFNRLERRAYEEGIV